jgi:hypothetical protein
LIGSLYTLCVVGMLYVALSEYGPLDPLSALCYGGAVVLALDGYRRIFRRI